MKRKFSLKTAFVFSSSKLKLAFKGKGVFMKIYNLFIAFVLSYLAFNLAFADTTASFEVQKLPVVQIEKLLVTPEKDHSDFITGIQSAKKYIHLEMFRVTDWGVVEALVAAKKNGVEVKVIVDQKMLSNQSRKFFDRLTAGGVEARGSTPGFSITHAKSMIVDGSKAYITAINLTQLVSRARDFGVVTSNQEVIDEMESVFQADWKNAQDKSANTPPLKVANLVWSPVNSRDKLVGLIDSAKQSIVSQVENLGDRAILDAFARAAARKVKVRLIVPRCDLNDNPTHNYPFSKALVQQGVIVQMMPSPSDANQPYMHSKMIVADDNFVYVGSVNFSKNSTQYARELGIIFPDLKTAQAISNYFEEDWKVSVPVPAQEPTDCPDFFKKKPKEGEAGGQDALH